MDNSDFEQQFMQNVNTPTRSHSPSPAQQPAISKPSNGSKLPLVIIAILAIALLVESIILISTLNNYFALTGNNDEEISEESAALVDPLYTWDEEGNLATMEITCTADDGSRFSLGKDGEYQEYNSSSNVVDSGTYSILNDSIIPLSSTKTTGEKVLYYTGFDLAYNTTIYRCNE